MKKILSASLIAVLVLSLGACGGGGGGSSSTTSTGSVGASNGFLGQVQKGPLIFGSEITIYELDEKLQQTGRSFDAQTTDDLGNFKVTANIATNLVTMVGVGYYMDETTGTLSSAPVTLNAIADLSVDSSPTINILTTLATPRIKKLILSGKTYTEAISQAQREVLAVFGIDASKITDLQALYAMKINGSGDQDSALLATSAVLSKMANTAAVSGSSAAAQMSYFLSRIASDIANTGALQTASIQTALNNASTAIRLSEVRSNIETYYANRGVTMVAPKFEEWINKDGSGLLPQRLNPPAGLSLAATTGVEAFQVVTSDLMTIAGLGSGVNDSVGIDDGAGLNPFTRILKNNAVVSGQYTTAKDGDVLALRRTSGGFGSTLSTTLSVGATAIAWNLTTRTPTVNYVSDGGCGAAGYPGDNSAVYHAFPIKPTQNISAKYVGVAMNGSGSSSIAIYTDNSGQPGSSIVTSTNKATFFSNGLSLPLLSGGSKSNFGGGNHYFLSSSGVDLLANTIYWVVVQFPSAADPGSYLHSLVPGGGFSTTQRMVSANGTGWSMYSGQASCRYHDQIPEVWLTN